MALSRVESAYHEFASARSIWAESPTLANAEVMERCAKTLCYEDFVAWTDWPTFERELEALYDRQFSTVASH